MSQSIKLSEALINEAKIFAQVYSRSVPKQIEYWSRIGKIAEENPDLPFAFIQDILLSDAEVEAGETTPYTFG